MGAHLQVEPVGAIPVAVNDVHFAITVEVGQGNSSSVLVGVVHTWGGKTGALRAAPPAGSTNIFLEPLGERWRVTLVLTLTSWSLWGAAIASPEFLHGAGGGTCVVAKRTRLVFSCICPASAQFSLSFG